MSNKIMLTYENGEFNVYINETVIYNDKDIENSFIKFKQEVKNNAGAKSDSWESVEENIKAYCLSGLEINKEFRTISFGKMKYFYNTDKVFYIENDSMISLDGGFKLFNFIINKISQKDLADEVSLLELCKIAMINKAIFSINEDCIMILSPMFSYGKVEFNFTNKKINKGTTSEKGTFEDFKNYVLEIFK